ncbi:MAG: hypothetical protein ACUVSK_14210, partial [Desulfotomaculales bacterium]
EPPPEEARSAALAAAPGQTHGGAEKKSLNPATFLNLTPPARPARPGCVPGCKPEKTGSRQNAGKGQGAGRRFARRALRFFRPGRTAAQPGRSPRQPTPARTVHPPRVVACSTHRPA